MPAFHVPPLKTEAMEADANLVANVWREKGPEAAVISFFMVSWLSDLVLWEQAALGSRIRYLAQA